MTQSALFDPELYTVPPAEPMSAGRRRTARQHMLVAIGVHPLARRPTRPELGTCGDCRFRELLSHHGRTYPKCTLVPERVNHSAGTDCRAWWPACPDHESRPAVPEED